MKKRMSSGLLIALILCWGSLAFTQPLTVPGMAPVKLFKAQTAQPPAEANIPTPPAPAPLAEAQLQTTVLQLRQAGGATPAPSTPSGGERITLTPNKPMAGKNYFNLSFGFNTATMNCAAINTSNGCFSFYFTTVPGKTYLVDFTLGGLHTWTCMGAIQGQMQTQNGHLLAGFTATATSANIYIKAAETGWGYFFGAQLIPVN